MCSALQNDSKQKKYRNDTCLPYFNMALNDLQEEFELNDIPVSEETSGVLQVNAGVVRIAFTGTTPTIPSDLVEIKTIWESVRDQNLWSPMTKKAFIPHYTEGIQVSTFQIWAWLSNEIKLPNSLQNNDLKLDYLKAIFTETTLATVDNEMGVQFKNCKSYLGFKTAAYCSMFIGENETRAAALESEANEALARSLGIAVKGKQVIAVRRRPFRFAFKTRRGMIRT